MNELTQRCLMLSNTEKTRLISALKASMETEPENDGSRFFLLYKAACDIFGKGIVSSSKLRELVVGRMMIVYQMRTEGFSLQCIGRHLVRHHAAVYHLQKQMENVFKFPHFYPKEIELWDRFQKNIKEYEKKARGQVV